MSISGSTYQQGAQFRATVVGDASSAGDIINVYEYQMNNGSNVSGATVLTDLEVILRGLYTLVALINNAVTVWRGFRVEELDGSNATGLLPFVGGDITGALTNDPVPSGVSALILFPTGVKRVLLKKYFGVLDESEIGPSGNIPTATLNDLGDIAAYLLAVQSFNQDWSYGFKSPKTGTFLIPDESTVSAIPAYQRRRKFRVGA